MTEKWYSIKAAANRAEVYIYDEIGAFGVSAKQFTQEFAAINASQILVRINSIGGDVFDGIAIHNAIKAKQADITTQVDGIAASIASIIMLAGKQIAIAKNGYVMIHQPWTFAMGNGEDLRKQADLLDKLSGTMATMYAAKTGKTAEQMSSVMSAVTWYTAEEAKAAGFVDAVLEEEGDLPAAAAKAVLKLQNPPEQIKKIAAKLIEKSAAADEQKARDMEAAKAETARIKREIEMDEQALLA